MSCSPPSSGVFSGGTISTALDIGPTVTAAPFVPLVVHAENADDAPDFTVTFPQGAVADSDVQVLLEARGDGEAALNLSDWNLDGGISFHTGATGTAFTPRSSLSSNASILAAGVSGAQTKLMVGGYVIVQRHSAPADGDLAAGDLALWFDQTNGAGNTKAMFKGKSADGTVKTASVVLA